MTDKKYTDKDIISSLEIIATTCNCNECKIRSGKWGTCNCSETTANAALDLINCQKAEIEKLEKILNGRDQLVNALNKCYNQAKSEAIKEFTEKLKEKISDCYIVTDGEYCGFDCGDVHECINNTLIEMIGEEE